jgi:hypothetical protein
MFDWGYNSFCLFELPKAGLLEFAELVDVYRKSGACLDAGYLPSERLTDSSALATPDYSGADSAPAHPVIDAASRVHS